MVECETRAQNPAVRVQSIAYRSSSHLAESPSNRMWQKLLACSFFEITIQSFHPEGADMRCRQECCVCKCSFFLCFILSPRCFPTCCEVGIGTKPPTRFGVKSLCSGSALRCDMRRGAWLCCSFHYCYRSWVLGWKLASRDQATTTGAKEQARQRTTDNAWQQTPFLFKRLFFSATDGSRMLFLL